MLSGKLTCVHDGPVSIHLSYVNSKQCVYSPLPPRIHTHKVLYLAVREFGYH